MGEESEAASSPSTHQRTDDGTLLTKNHVMSLENIPHIQHKVSSVRAALHKGYGLTAGLAERIALHSPGKVTEHRTDKESEWNCEILGCATLIPYT